MTHARSFFDPTGLTDDALQSFDMMMSEAALKVEGFAGLATAIWGEVLEELSKRGHVTLASGTFDDVGSAIVIREYYSGL